MVSDANLTLQSAVTKTATFSGSWVPIPGVGGQRGLFAHVAYSAATNASGSNSVTFSLDVSPDNGSTVYSSELAGADQVLTLTTSAQVGRLFFPIPLFDKVLLAGTSPAARLTCTIAGAGSTPTITYSSTIQPGWTP